MAEKHLTLLGDPELEDLILCDDGQYRHPGSKYTVDLELLSLRQALAPKYLEAIGATEESMRELFE